MSGGRSWRLALRIARRDARRARARTALVAVLIALPVAGGAAADVYWRSSELDPRDRVTVELGVAQARVDDAGTAKAIVQSPDAVLIQEVGGGSQRSSAVRDQAQVDAAITALLPLGDRLLTARTWLPGRPVTAGDIDVRADLSDEAYTEPERAGRIVQVSGRAPLRQGEAAVTPTLAASLGVGLGDRFSAPTPDGATATLVVVGLAHQAAHPRTAGTPTVYLAPDSLGIPVEGQGEVGLSRWIVGPEPVTWDLVRRLNRMGMSVVSREVLLNPPPESAVDPAVHRLGFGGAATLAASAALFTGLVMLQICLMAGPAVAVGVRRQQRTLALVAATGGARADRRRLVLAGGLVTGMLAGAVGLAVGVALGTVAVHWMRHRGRSVLPRVDLRPAELVGLALVAVLAAVAASVLPAWHAGRRDVVVSLHGGAGRRDVKPLPAVGGVLLALAGASGLVVANNRHQDLLALGSLAGLEIGLLLIVPATIALVARTAAHAPVPLRIAMRDSDRHRSRTVPAVAATMAAVAGAVTALVAGAALQDRTAAQWRYEAAPGRVVVTGTNVPQEGDASIGRPATPVSRPASLAQLLARTLPLVPGAWAPLGDMVTELGQVPSVSVVRPDGCELTENSWCSDGDGRIAVGSRAVVADGHALGLLLDEPEGPPLRAATAALARGEIVVGHPADVGPDGRTTLTMTTFSSAGDAVTTRHRVRAHVWTGDGFRPHLPVLGESAVRSLGLTPAMSSVVAELTRFPSAKETARVQTAAQAMPDRPLPLVERGPVTESAWIWLTLALALVVAGVGTFSAVALALAEGRADAATLSALGASPRTRRLLASAQASVISGVGTALGLLAGVFTAWTVCRRMVAYTPGLAWYEVREQGVDGRTWVLDVPWTWVAAVAVGLPLLTSSVVVLVTRSRLPLTRWIGQ